MKNKVITSEAKQHKMEGLLRGLRVQLKEIGIDIDSEIDREMLIPRMIFLTFVENAIKHGISQLSTGGSIQINASLKAEHLQIEVTNTGQLHKKGKREGIGLKNLIERLQILFGQFADLQLENSGKDTVTASLKIPLS